ncbi:N-6 DNA methylase, partial [Rodentibacter pneumotropicus]
MDILLKIKLAGELNEAVNEMTAETNPIQKISLAGKVQSLLAQLGVIQNKSEPQSTVNPEDLFNYNPEGVTAKQRQNANNAAIEIVRKVQAGELSIDDITPEQKIVLSTYSGSGGGLTTAEGTRGSSYEYYTPKPIAQRMWDLLKEMGFNGGTVLDPCAGTGIFSATAPQNALMESIELDKTSGTINRILFNDDNHKVTISPFEAVAAATEDEIVDAVITNVPFGDNRGGNQFKDSRYQNENLESYFILRSLDKLRPNGLAV